MGGQPGMRRPQRARFSLAALLLITAGVVLLLNTTGVVGYGIWEELAGYWPVLLILVGVAILLGRRAPLVCAAIASLALAATVAAAFVDTARRPEGHDVTSTYWTPLDNVERLHLVLTFGGGSVELGAEPEGAAAGPGLLSATFSGGRPGEIGTTRFGPNARIELNSGGFADWHLGVARDIALSIEVNAGAAELDLDLSGLNVEWLSINGGASDIWVRLPSDAGDTRVEIAGGVAAVELVVPEMVSAWIDSDTVLSSSSIDESRFPRTRYQGRFLGDDATYRSPDYDTANNRARIEIDAAAADVTIH